MVGSWDDQRQFAGWRLSWEDLKSQFLVTVEDVQRVVEITTDDEVLGGARERVRSLEDLDIGGVEDNGVVPPEIAIGLEAEYLFELECRVEWPVDIGEVVTNESKATVVVLGVGTLQEVVG